MAQDESGIHFVPPSGWSSPAGSQQNQYREQVSAYAYPDFCATVDGGTTDNTMCLMDALAATGLYFSTLELPALPPCGTCATQSQTNYVCTSLGLTWPNPTARIHIWKGATVSCAFPPADATHIIQDDNQAPIIPWSSATFPSTNGGAVYTCQSCSPQNNDMTASGTYTGQLSGNYCIQIQSTTTKASWGFNVASNEVVSAMNCTTNPNKTITAGGTIPLSNGISVSFVGATHTAGETWSVAVTPAGVNPVNPQDPVSIAVPTTADVLCASGADSTISGVMCVNTSNDTMATSFQTTVPIPVGTWATGRAFRVTAQFALWTSGTPPNISRISLAAGTMPLATATGPIVPTASLTNSGFSASWLLVAAHTPGYYVAQPLYNTLPGATTTTAASQVAQPVNAGTAAFRFGILNTYSLATTGNAIQLQSLVVERIN